MTHTPHNQPPAPHQPELRNPEVDFEKKDVRIPTLLIIGLGLILLVVLAQFIAWRTFISLNARQHVYQEELSPLSQDNKNIYPPEPRLQGAPGHPMFGPEELRKVQAAANSQLSTYGWQDQTAGLAHIPIDRAIDILAATGLPSVPPSAPVKSSPAPAASASHAAPSAPPASGGKP